MTMTTAEKVQAFKLFYSALYDAQSTYLKHNWVTRWFTGLSRTTSTQNDMDNWEEYRVIQQRAKKKGSRSKAAWDLVAAYENRANLRSAAPSNSDPYDPAHERLIIARDIACFAKSGNKDQLQHFEQGLQSRISNLKLTSNGDSDQSQTTADRLIAATSNRGPSPHQTASVVDDDTRQHSRAANSSVDSIDETRCSSILSIDLTPETRNKLTAFEKIYPIISEIKINNQASTENILTNPQYLNDTLNGKLDLINRVRIQYPNSRLAAAWQLAEKYIADSSKTRDTNLKLNIVLWSFYPNSSARTKFESKIDQLTQKLQSPIAPAATAAPPASGIPSAASSGSSLWSCISRYLCPCCFTSYSKVNPSTGD